MDSFSLNNHKGIKILGGGCANCHKLLDNTVEALQEMGVAEDVELITDHTVIASYGVMMTPALVIDGKTMSIGKVLKKDAVIRLYKEARG